MKIIKTTTIQDNGTEIHNDCVPVLTLEDFENISSVLKEDSELHIAARNRFDALEKLIAMQGEAISQLLETVVAQQKELKEFDKRTARAIRFDKGVGW